jgi:S-adenosylmethionine:tRNA ribosyltransferase-isomerase
MRVDVFDFDLPPDRIANRPAEPRESAKMLHVGAGDIADRSIAALPGLVRPGDVFVFNDTRVIPARLYGRRGDVDVEVLLHRRDTAGAWQALARPAKRLKDGHIISFADDFAATVIGRTEDGSVKLRFDMEDEKFQAALAKHGHMPLPPYIQRADDAQDVRDYQTIYARADGAVAAPTAGLHFTPDLIEQLRQAGAAIEFLTLHVGLGTFQPVKCDDTKDHVMHREWAEVTAETAARINAARSNGGRIVAVGTTSLRALEAAANDDGTVPAFAAETDLFIVPGYRFKAVDVLLTNFHLPRSTLFMLVSAFAGLSRMQAAYAHAIANGYRFYSYGDACLLERSAAA